MSNQEIEPLEPSLWFAELERLSSRRAQVDGEAPDALFRKAFYLVQLTPLPLRELLPARVDEETIEAFLDCGAYLAAAMALFARPTSVTLVRESASKLFRATIGFPGATSVGEDFDKEPAKAMLGAWCQAVLSLRTSDENSVPNLSNLRTRQSGPSPMPIRH